MKKILFISNISKGRISNFALSSIKAAKELGFEFHSAANWSNATSEQIKNEERKYGIKIHHIDFIRNPFHPLNFRAYKQLINLIKNENFDVIHCNTPVGGVYGRLAAKRLSHKKVLYMAHGFHFYRGAPLKNWLLYYTAEKMMSHLTDELITINEEDYNRAKKFKLRKNGEVHYVPGVGIDLSKYNIEVNKEKLRKELGIPKDAFVIISVGELNSNKNHEVIIKSVAELENKNIYYLICGNGKLKSYLIKFSSSLKISDQIKFLGFRTDIPQLLKVSDVFAFPSKREGLGLAALEAMASGLPLVTSNVHGILDYSIDGVTGYNYSPNDFEGFAEGINTLYNNNELRYKIGLHNQQFVKKFDLSNSVQAIKKVYIKIIS